MKFQNRQEECELAEMNTKGYCKYGARHYRGGRRCIHKVYKDLEARLYCPYYWKGGNSGGVEI
jgi:hypothetical protein